MSGRKGQPTIQPNQPQTQKHKTPNTPPKSSKTPPHDSQPNTASHSHSPQTHTHTHAQTNHRVVRKHLRPGESRKASHRQQKGRVRVPRGAAKQPSNQTNHKSKTQHAKHTSKVIQNTTTSHPTPHRFTLTLPTHTHTHTHTHNHRGGGGTRTCCYIPRRKTTEGGRVCAM